MYTNALRFKRTVAGNARRRGGVSLARPGSRTLGRCAPSVSGRGPDTWHAGARHVFCVFFQVRLFALRFFCLFLGRCFLVFVFFLFFGVYFSSKVFVGILVWFCVFLVLEAGVDGLFLNGFFVPSVFWHRLVENTSFSGKHGLIEVKEGCF